MARSGYRPSASCGFTRSLSNLNKIGKYNKEIGEKSEKIGKPSHIIDTIRS